MCIYIYMYIGQKYFGIFLSQFGNLEIIHLLFDL